MQLKEEVKLLKARVDALEGKRIRYKCPYCGLVFWSDVGGFANSNQCPSCAKPAFEEK